LGEVNLQDDADNTRYDEAANLIYVGFGEGGIAIITRRRKTNRCDQTFRASGSVRVGKGPRIFNLPNRHLLAVIDRGKGAVVRSWPPGSALANFPMVLDEMNHRLMIGCRSPSKLIVLNSESGNLMAELGISGDPDDLFYDRKRGYIYAICGAGKISRRTTNPIPIAYLPGWRLLPEPHRTFVPERKTCLSRLASRHAGG
jgi:hypothetical protein